MFRWFRRRFHWQNLNEKANDRTGSGLRHGRAWFRPFGYDSNVSLRWEWSFFTHFVALEFEVGSGDGNDGLALWVACGLFSVHFDVEGIVPRWFLERGRKKALGTKYLGYEYMAWPRKTGIRFFDNTIWFDIWNWDFGWSSSQPKWLSFNFCPVDFLLGRPKYNHRVVSKESAVVPMPERAYPATVEIAEDTWKRPRSPFTRRITRATVEVENGVPHPGKGENSWDCGEDATYSLTCAAGTASEAIGKMVASVLESRQRYGGKNWVPETVR